MCWDVLALWITTCLKRSTGCEFHSRILNLVLFWLFGPERASGIIKFILEKELQLKREGNMLRGFSWNNLCDEYTPFDAYNFGCLQKMIKVSGFPVSYKIQNNVMRTHYVVPERGKNVNKSEGLKSPASYRNFFFILSHFDTIHTISMQCGGTVWVCFKISIQRLSGIFIKI